MGVRADHFSFGFLISISILSLLAMVTASTKGTFTPSDALRALNRSYYPHDFSWGAASAAYQVLVNSRLYQLVWCAPNL